MHTLGEDFTYMNARIYFKNMDKLIHFINRDKSFNIKIRYSTPRDYIQAIQNEKVVYPNKTDDFFPYSDGDHAFWTGFFTSRVSLKGFVKDFSRYMQAVRRNLA